MPSTHDEHPIKQLSTDRTDPSLGHRVRAWRPHRRRQGSDALGGEDGIEGGGEVGVAVANQERELVDAVCQTDQQVAGQLGHPHPSRAGGHPEDVDPAGRQLDHQQHVPTLEQDRVDVEDVGGQDPFGPGRQQLPPRQTSPGAVPGALPASPGTSLRTGATGSNREVIAVSAGWPGGAGLALTVGLIVQRHVQPQEIPWRQSTSVVAGSVPSMSSCPRSRRRGLRAAGSTHAPGSRSTTAATVSSPSNRPNTTTTRPAGTPGIAASLASTSSAYRLRPLTLVLSPMRPRTNNSPSSRKPASPVHSCPCANLVGPLACAPWYPSATHGPDATISPSRPSPSGAPSASTTHSRMPGRDRPQPTSQSPRPRSRAGSRQPRSRTRTGSPNRSEARSADTSAGSSPRLVPVRARVASARP